MGLRDSKVLDHLVCSQAKELPQCHYALMAAQTRISDKQLSLMHSLTDASSLSSPYRGWMQAPFSQKNKSNYSRARAILALQINSEISKH